MKHVTTSTLTELQQTQIAELVTDCCTKESIRLSYPLAEQGDDCFHSLLYDEKHSLIAALALLTFEDGSAECSAFTSPTHRRKGFFHRLFSHMLPLYEDYDILFGITDGCKEAIAVLSSMEADQQSCEHQMELCLTDRPPLPPLFHPSVTCSMTENSSDLWQLSDRNQLIGVCHITPVSATCVCLHQVEIFEQYQKQGYGSDLLACLFTQLQQQGFHTVILQVSGENHAALSLYEKTGFQITETLSYFLY